MAKPKAVTPIRRRTYTAGDIVTVVNRTADLDLQVNHDGKSYPLPANSETPLPFILAFFAWQQNPIMGTENPGDPSSFQSLIGIKELDKKYPCDPVIQMPALERLDRTRLPRDRQDIEIHETLYRTRGSVAGGPGESLGYGGHKQ